MLLAWSMVSWWFGSIMCVWFKLMLCFMTII